MMSVNDAFSCKNCTDNLTHDISKLQSELVQDLSEVNMVLNLSPECFSPKLIRLGKKHATLGDRRGCHSLRLASSLTPKVPDWLVMVLPSVFFIVVVDYFL